MNDSLPLLIDQVLAAHPTLATEFLNTGDEQAFQSLMRQVMIAARGKVNPAQVVILLRELSKFKH